MKSKRSGPILVVGESLIDVVEAEGHGAVECVGGSGANAAVALSRLGCSVWLASAVGPDDRGRRIRTRLAEEGIRWASDPVTLDRTGVARAHIDSDGHAAYDFAIDWRLSVLRDDVPAPVALQVSSLAPTMLPGARGVLAIVRQYCQRTLVAYDVNIRPAITGSGPEVRAAVEAMIALSDVVKVSDEDLAALYPGRDEAHLIEYVLSLGPVAVVITRGGDRAQWCSPTGAISVRSPVVPVIDTIGAGDTFGAAMLDALVRSDCAALKPRGRVARMGDDEVERVLRRAAKAAAITCSRVGADPPYRGELVGSLQGEAHRSKQRRR